MLLLHVKTLRHKLYFRCWHRYRTSRLNRFHLLLMMQVLDQINNINKTTTSQLVGSNFSIKIIVLQVASARSDRILLQIKRGTTTYSPHRLLQLLLSEQEVAKETQRQGNPEFEHYIRSNLQELADNPNPLPDATPSRLVWPIYFRVLQDQIDKTAKELDTNGSQISTLSRHSGKRKPSRQLSSSDSDLDTVCAKKAFCPCVLQGQTEEEA